MRVPRRGAALAVSIAWVFGVLGMAPARAATVDRAGALPVSSFDSGVTRLAGPNRYSTAVRASERFSPGVPVVYVATGQDFPDALGAAAAAARLGGPLLLTEPTALPAEVASELRRLAPQRIVVVGGPAVVGADVADPLGAVAPVRRLFGANRYETSLAIARDAFSSSDFVLIATGRTFPDALSGTGVAALRQGPVILVDGSAQSTPAAALEVLDGFGVQSVAIAGGVGAVSGGISTQLQGRGFAVSRFGGADRYATAASLNDAFFPSGSVAQEFIATGESFPDALSGAALAGQLLSPVYVTSGPCAPAPIRASRIRLGAGATVVLGGVAVVSEAAAANLGCLATTEPTISGAALLGSSLVADTGRWTEAVTFSYQWMADGVAVSGATGPVLALTAPHVGKRISVRVTGSAPGYVSAAAVSSATASVGYPGRISVNSWDCPSWAPIKGNRNSMIYHVPSGAFYSQTKPEECFRTEADAVAAGYRRSLR